MEKTFADPVMNRVDGVIYKISGVDPKKGMTWWQYAIALLITNAAMILIGYVILRIQSLPIFNPNNIGSMEETLSFNTIISFMTNTNLQHYSGESGLSYFVSDACYNIYDVCFRRKRICGMRMLYKRFSGKDKR